MTRQPGHALRWKYVTPALAFVLALAVLLPLRLHNHWDLSENWILSDEGHQAYQAVRWLGGQTIFQDFATDNYPPGMIVLNGLLFRAFGERLSVLRTLLAVLGAGTATLMYLIARRLMPGWPAAWVYALGLTWNVPALNIPYPSWVCVVLGLGAFWALLRYQEDDRAAWLALAGALTGLSAGFKLTQGAFQAVGLGLALAWRSAVGRRRWRGGEILAAGLSLGLGALVLRVNPEPANLLLFGLPLAGLAGAIGVGWPRAAARDRPAVGRRFGAEALWLGAGFLAVLSAWAVPTVLAAGWAAGLDGLIGAPLRHSSYMLAIAPPLTPHGWLMIAWAVAGGLGLGLKTRWTRGTLGAYGALGLLLLILPLEGSGLWSTVFAGLRTWDRLRYVLWLLVAAGLCVALRRRALPAAQRELLMALLAYGTWNFLQVFPLVDENHLLWSIQPAFIGLGYLLHRAGRSIRERWGVRRWMWALLGFPAMLLAAQIYPLVDHFYRLGWTPEPIAYVRLDARKADISVRPATATRLRHLAQAVNARTTESDTIFDTSGAFLYFWTGRQNPTRQDCVWPGYLTTNEETRLVADLVEHRPALVIRRESSDPILAAHYPELMRYLDTAYRPAEQVGEYTLWERQ